MIMRGTITVTLKEDWHAALGTVLLDGVNAIIHGGRAPDMHPTDALALLNAEDDAARDAAADAALGITPPPAKPKRERNLAREARQPGAPSRKEISEYWGECVANYIRALPEPPRIPVPHVDTALSAACLLMDLGVTSSSHLARILGRSQKYGSVLMNRARNIRGAQC